MRDSIKKILKEEMSDNISEQDKIIAIKKLLKSKEYLPSSYHEKIDDLIRELLGKINIKEETTILNEQLMEDRQPITFDYVRESVADYLEDNPEDLEGIPSDKLDDAYDNIAEGIMIEFRDNMDNLWNYPSFDSLIWVYTDEFKDYD